MIPTKQPSSEPSWVTIYDGSDRDWRLISMYELKELGYAINEDEPGHLKELHDSGNKIIAKVRSRQFTPQTEQEKVLDDFVLWNDTREIFHIVQDYKRHLRQQGRK
jgi:hypothetical protein